VELKVVPVGHGLEIASLLSGVVAVGDAVDANDAVTLGEKRLRQM
jgi:hypothetical protein